MKEEKEETRYACHFNRMKKKKEKNPHTHTQKHKAPRVDVELNDILFDKNCRSADII